MNKCISERSEITVMRAGTGALCGRRENLSQPITATGQNCRVVRSWYAIPVHGSLRLALRADMLLRNIRTARSASQRPGGNLHRPCDRDNGYLVTVVQQYFYYVPSMNITYAIYQKSRGNTGRHADCAVPVFSVRRRVPGSRVPDEM